VAAASTTPIRARARYRLPNQPADVPVVITTALVGLEALLTNLTKETGTTKAAVSSEVWAFTTGLANPVVDIDLVL